MNYIKLGNSNLMVSRLAMGAMGFGSHEWREWVLNEPDSRIIIKTALDGGINFFDTCDFYSNGKSEEILGRSILKYVSRDEVVIATKVGNPMGGHPNARGFSRKHIFDAIDASLKRLGTDYIDLYQTHVWADDTNLEELADAFADLVRVGKARYIGVTTMPAWCFGKILAINSAKSSPPFISMQCEYNLCHREAERELIPLCRQEGVALIPFSPFARGFLSCDRRQTENASLRTKSDSYTNKHYYRDSDFSTFELIKNVGRKRNVTSSQLALAWVLQQSGITAPIFGATRPEHIGEAIRSLGVELEREDLLVLEREYQPRPIRSSGH